MNSLVLVKQTFFIVRYVCYCSAIAKKKKNLQFLILAIISQRPFLPFPLHPYTHPITLLLSVRDKYHRGEIDT